MDRILNWAFVRYPDGGVLLPAYYLETDYEPVAVRVRAESAPAVNDARFDIMVDGVSIFNDKEEVKDSPDIYYQLHHVPNTSVELAPKETIDLMGEDFKENLIMSEGSWVTCKVTNDSGARNVSIQLELQTITEPDDNEDEEEQ